MTQSLVLGALEFFFAKPVVGNFLQQRCLHWLVQNTTMLFRKSVLLDELQTKIKTMCSPLL